MAAEPDWGEVERLFDGALEQPAPERDAWLGRATADAALRGLVQRMLRAHDQPDGPLDHPLDAAPISLPDRLEAALGERYEISTEIGRGGMALVYLAQETKHDRAVVIKVLNPEVAYVSGAERFLAEIQVAAQLSHPHILAVLDSGEADGLFYYVMPYLGGETLRTRLRREGRLPVSSAQRILADLADALATAHRAGVVHRDLKPENVLLVGDHAYLLDFGIAQLRVAGGDRITGQGAVLGTVGYMSPEQAAGGATDARADLYAWGVLAREMLTGQEPGVIGSILPATLPSETPAALLEAVEHCLSPEIETRPPDADALLARLRGERAPSSARRAASSGRRRGLLVAGTAALLLLAGWYWLMPRRPGGPVRQLASPVVVAPLVNETGDSTLAPWGRMAGDWITQGLQETGAVTVISWPNAREADQRYRKELADGHRPEVVHFLGEETGAGTVITGAYYLTGGRVRFQAQITDVATGTLLAHPEPAEAPRDSVDLAVRHLRSRVMGALAVWHDTTTRVPGLMERPPTFEAYQAFDRGVGLHLQQEYDSAAAAFTEAFRLDSTFGTALIYAGIDLWNANDFAAVDSVLHTLRSRSIPLTEFHALMADYLAALLAGEGTRALATMRRASQLSPDARGLYTVAWAAIATNRPAEALHVLDSLDPDRGALRGWAPYWLQRAHAEHQLGRFAEELASVRAMRVRHPENRSGLVLEVRAAAASGNTALVDSLLDASMGLPHDTYWSQGAAMVVAAEELSVHGRAFAAGPYYGRAIRWLANQLAREPQHRAHRYWIGAALYDAGRWPEAAPYFESLARDFPDRVDYRGLSALMAARAGRAEEALRRLGPRPQYNPGEHTAYRARLAAALGHREESIALLAQAATEGYPAWPWLHSSAYRDFGPFASDPAYRALMGPTTR